VAQYFRCNFLLSCLGLYGLVVFTGCNNNQKDEKKLDTVYEHTDPDGHPLDNRDTVIEYKEIDSANRDTSLRGDKH
jgi:hypothetical protein